MVGLVEDRDLDRVQVDVAGLQVVLEAARARDDDVDPGAKPGDLRVGADAAEDGDGAKPHGLGQRGERRVDLRSELTGGREDEGPRAAWPPGRGVRREPREQRQGEGVGLAGARTAAAEDVASRQRVRQGRGLDGERGRDALGGQDVGEGLGHAEVRERGAGNERAPVNRRSGVR